MPIKIISSKKTPPFETIDPASLKDSATSESYSKSLIPRRRRSTLTMSSAFRYKPIFDECIKDGQDKLIPYSGSPTAFHTKISDALLWLVENYDMERRDVNDVIIHQQGAYLKLRNAIRVRSEDKGIHIAFYTNRVAPTYYNVNTDLNANKTWKDQIDIYLSDPQMKGVPKTIKGLNLSQDEIDQLKYMFSKIKENQPDFIFDITGTTIRLSK